MNNLITIKINWLHSNGALTQKIPLDGAEITADDKDGIPLWNSYGALKNGVFTFSKSEEEDDFQGITIYAKHENPNETGNSRFSVFNQNKKGERELFSLSIKKEHLWPIEEDVYEYDLPEHEWYVFQAFVNLTKIAQEQLGFSSEGKNRSIVIDDAMEDGAFFDHGDEKNSGSIFLSKSATVGSWDAMAHEFAHAIFYESDTTDASQGGQHDGSNHYDYLPKNISEAQHTREVEIYNKLVEEGKALQRLVKAANESGKKDEALEQKLRKKITEFSNQKNKVNLAYKNKEKSMALAFNEGAATWLGMALLEHSEYKYIKGKGTKEIKGVGGSLYRNDNDLDSNLGKDRDNYFGEDAEFAIARLLWNITNKEHGGFERIKAKSGVVNKVNISLKTLFDGVFKDKKLKNISDFYQKLFNYYIFQNDPNKIAFDGYELKDLEKIGALGNLFAEFGIAPDIDNMTQEDNKLVWYQYKTGELPAHDTFEVFFFDEHLGDASRGYWLGETYECEIEPVKVSEGKYRYEYPINDIVWGNVELYDEDRIHLLIRVKNKKENLNTGPYLNYSMTDFTPSNIVSRYLGVVAHFPTNAVSLSGLGYVPAENGVFEFYFMDITSGEIHANYTGISGGEKNIPRHTITYYLGMDTPPYYGEIYIGS